MATSLDQNSPALADLDALQYLLEYAKYLGPSWFKQLLARIIPSPAAQRLRKSVIDIDTESKKILSDKRAGLKAGDKDIVHEFAEKKDVMSILRKSSSRTAFFQHTYVLQQSRRTWLPLRRKNYRKMN